MHWIVPVGSVGLLLLGMFLMTSGLRRAGEAQRLLNGMQQDVLSAFAAGLFGTILLQSSSAVTALLAGACDAGQLRRRYAAAAIMGANLGTTATGWLLCLGLQEHSWLPIGFTLIVLMVSLIRHKMQTARCCAGILCILLSLRLLTQLADGLPQLLSAAEPMQAFGAAVGITAALQSSGVCIVLLQAAARDGALSLRLALPIVLGANIGTCSTVWLAAIPAGRSAKWVAAVHLGFNLIAAVLMGALGFALGSYVRASLTPYSVAALHTLTNLLPTVLLLPQLLSSKKRVADLREL
jgi:phosphate:Na+ symporter